MRGSCGIVKRYVQATSRWSSPPTRAENQTALPMYGDVVDGLARLEQIAAHVGLREVEARRLAGLEHAPSGGGLGQRLARQRHAHVARAGERVDAVVRAARMPGTRLVLLEQRLDVRRCRAPRSRRALERQPGRVRAARRARCRSRGTRRRAARRRQHEQRGAGVRDGPAAGGERAHAPGHGLERELGHGPDGSLARCPESSTASASTAASPASPARRAASGARPPSRSPRRAATSSTSTAAIPPRRARDRGARPPQRRRRARSRAADADACERAIESAAAAFGRLDILVNSAGVVARGTALDVSAEDARARAARQPRTACSRSRARRAACFVAQGSGAIVNVASLLAFQGGVRVSAYATAKHGVARV